LRAEKGGKFGEISGGRNETAEWTRGERREMGVMQDEGVMRF